MPCPPLPLHLACSPALQELLRWLEDRRSSAGDRLHALLCRCLEQGSWRQHCQRLLQLLPQQDLLPFALDLLAGSSFPAASSASRGADAAQPAVAVGGGAWLVFRRAQWQSLEQLALAAALGCSLPLLLRLLRDEEWADERQAVERLVHQLLLPPARTAEQGQQQGPEQGQEQGQQPPSERQQAEACAEAAAQRVAAHWRLRRQLAQQRSAASEARLQEVLLLHLFAAAFLVQQLSSSGRRSDAEQLQQLLSASGLPCELVAPGSPASGRHAERSKKRRSSSKQRRHSKRRRSSKHKGSSRKHKRKKSKRRSGSYRSGSSESEDTSGSGSDSEEAGCLFAAFGADATGEEQATQLLWRLQRPDGSAATVSSLELVDAVVDAAAWAHACWLFARE